MKNLIIFLMLTVIVVINFSGCGEAQQRPAQINKKISAEVIDMTELSDITSAEGQDSAQNISFKNQLIGKIEDADQREKAQLLLAQNRLVYMFMEGKVVVLELLPAAANKNAKATEVELAKDKSLHTFASLMALKKGQEPEIQDIKISTWSQNQFSILAEIAVQTGILENEKTDYNEKKSILNLTETPLEQAQVLILKSEIKTATQSTAGEIGDDQK